MDGFKNSTKTQYAKGGSCYAKGGSVKGAAKISKVMGEFKSGELHSGSKKGPTVTNPKQATAIALSEARKAGAKIPVKKANGGVVERDASARRVQAEEAGEDAIMGMPRAKGDDFRKKRGIEVTKTTVREIGPRTDIDKRLSRPVSREEMAQAARSKGSFRNTPLIGGALGTVRDIVKEATGFKKGGLATMPRGKKC